MIDYIITKLHWWLAYLCCAAQYGYASWCQAPWVDDDSVRARQEWKQDRRSLKQLVFWVRAFSLKYRKELVK